MIGRGRAHGAVSVLNAIPTGYGGAVGVDLPVTAEVRLTDEGGIAMASTTPWGSVAPDPAILEALREAASLLGHGGGLEVFVESGIPPASGLKSSSAVINAVLAAILDALGEEIGAEEVAGLGVRVARAAGLTITGAYDDSLATLLCGVFITDNPSMRVLRRFFVDGDLYAVIRVPQAGRPINTVDPGAFQRFRWVYERAVRLALEGEWLDAATLNGVATLAATGWDREASELVSAALTLPSVEAAGVSGKGPAVFALTRDPGEVTDAWGRERTLVTKVLGGCRDR